MKLVKRADGGRLSMLGLAKFLAILAIVYYHLQPTSLAKWTRLYLLVEFFFIISGYFTFKHFQKYITSTTENKSKRAIRYTVRRIKHFLPYVLVSTLIQISIRLYVTRGETLTGKIGIFLTAIFDSCFLSSQNGIVTSPLWFMSALIIVTPIFAIICQTKRKDMLYIITALTTIIYYGEFFGDHIIGAKALVRTLAGLLTGITVYGFSDYLSKCDYSMMRRLLLQFLEIAAIVVGVICLYPSVTSPYNIPYGKCFVLMTVIFLTIFLSRQTWTSRIRSQFFDLLESISLAIFMTHYELGLYYKRANYNYLSLKQKLLYLIFATLLGAAVFFMIEYFKNQRHREKTKKGPESAS